ncbi:DEAD/DEAH box helicase family protein, partial [Chlamydia psittaci 08DC60]
ILEKKWVFCIKSLMTVIEIKPGEKHQTGIFILL